MDVCRLRSLLARVARPVPQPEQVLVADPSYADMKNFFDCPRCMGSVAVTPNRRARKHSPGESSVRPGQPVCEASGMQVSVRGAGVGVVAHGTVRMHEEAAETGPRFPIVGVFGGHIDNDPANPIVCGFDAGSGMSVDLRPCANALLYWYQDGAYASRGLTQSRLPLLMLHTQSRGEVDAEIQAEAAIGSGRGRTSRVWMQTLPRSRGRVVRLEMPDGWRVAITFPDARDTRPVDRNGNAAWLDEQVVAGLPFGWALENSRTVHSLLSCLRDVLVRTVGATGIPVYRTATEAMTWLGWAMLGITDLALTDALERAGFDPRRRATMDRLRTWLDAGWSAEETAAWAQVVPMPWQADLLVAEGVDLAAVTGFVQQWRALAEVGLSTATAPPGSEHREETSEHFTTFFEHVARWAGRDGWTVEGVLAVSRLSPTLDAAVSAPSWVALWTRLFGPDMADRYARTGMEFEEAVVLHHGASPPSAEQLDLLLALQHATD